MQFSSSMTCSCSVIGQNAYAVQISFLAHKKSEEVKGEEAEKEVDNNDDDNINN